MLPLLLVVALLAAGCGEEEREPATATATTAEPATAGPAHTATAAPARARTGTRITARGSRFGTMLWGPKRQAIYIFEHDSRGRSRCSGECAEAWPPVYTKGRPVAGRGVRKSLLGTIRRGKRRQVTYAGRPLYYYAHEGPGQVLCHNVDLHGGLWWVVGPNGRRRP